ncbi:hypothetical protein J2Z76_002581 [Sedimentibacter acidaminivorans]|uniref:TrbC/VIRB2 family protein n=1 Tax=Sedimentibacter acidaminivorans TaxID=913099 RepID=A0ABS4GGA2_9FIRM|nr:hypothetical protein [Sedimentibacter acidaminivorans]MBP1926711.1 hypothetical protein [Sedimentibacter acidaminivorans]
MKKIKKLSIIARNILAMIAIYTFNCTTVFASTTAGVDKFDNMVVWIASWVGRVGLLVAFWGGVQIAFSLSDHDAGQKRNGILFLVAGLMVFGLSVGYKTLLGL